VSRLLAELSPECGWGHEVFAFFIELGSNFLEGEFTGDIQARFDVGRRKNEAGEGHAFERRKIRDRCLADVQALKRTATEWG
jgi:hypothetical protein